MCDNTFPESLPNVPTVTPPEARICWTSGTTFGSFCLAQLDSRRTMLNLPFKEGLRLLVTTTDIRCPSLAATEEVREVDPTTSALCDELGWLMDSAGYGIRRSVRIATVNPIATYDGFVIVVNYFRLMNVSRGEKADRN